MTTMTKLFAAFLLTTAAAPAFAQTAVGLTGDRTLVMIDPATAAVTGTVEVTGANRLLGIDWRPGNQTLIGVTDTQAIVSIDWTTGAATELATMNTMLPVGDGPVIVEVNPVPDRLRFMSGLVNHRVNMDTGEVTVDGGLKWDPSLTDMKAAPMVAGTAYLNAYGKPEATAMYNIDSAMNGVVQQTAPNDGIIMPIGELGVMLEGPVGFDVATTADGTNTAWLVANGGLHTVDLATGRVTESWTITGTDQPIRDLAVVPAM